MNTSQNTPQQKLLDQETIVDQALWLPKADLPHYQKGAAMRTIVRDKLYRQNGYATFADYCEERWGFSPERGYQYIRQADILDILGQHFEKIPQTSTSVGCLKNLKQGIRSRDYDDDAICAVWRDASKNGTKPIVLGAEMRDALRRYNAKKKR